MSYGSQPSSVKLYTTGTDSPSCWVYRTNTLNGDVEYELYEKGKGCTLSFSEQDLPGVISDKNLSKIETDMDAWVWRETKTKSVRATKKPVAYH